MVKKVIAAVALIALLTVAIVQAMDKNTQTTNNNSTQTADSQSDGLKIGEKAPNFTLKTLNGETVKLSDYKGKKVMLNFWATWCPPCKAEMPEIEKYYLQHNKEIQILAVNIDTQDDVKGFVNKNGITFPILLDTNNAVNTTYQILSIPTTFFIDENGVIQNKFTGSMTQDMIKQFVSEMK